VTHPRTRATRPVHAAAICCGRLTSVSRGSEPLRAAGLLPAWLGRARAPGETPVAALWAMTAVGLGIVLI
jgi:amino acid transporter